MKNVTAMNLLIYPFTKIMPTFWQSYLFSFVANWQYPLLLYHWASCIKNKFWCQSECYLKQVWAFLLCTAISAIHPILHLAHWAKPITRGGVRIWVHQARCCTFWAAWLGRGVRRDFNLSQPVVWYVWQHAGLKLLGLPMSGCPLTTHRLSVSWNKTFGKNSFTKWWKPFPFTFQCALKYPKKWSNISCICMLIDTPLY